ncbi:DoxX family protein [Runella sp.]|jgi:uncharacterized membrane protein|uniref:DoxX family protein n=1 Tax=Runella sp. TaxID=1960881 RepID=UPI002626C2F1|nr:DoxX family protein [Runella sp.]
MSIYFLAGLLIAAGILHLVKPKLYKRMMPPRIPAPQFSIFISGVFEIVFGAGLLFVQTRSWSAWGTILLFIAIFPANVYMFTSGRFSRIPKLLLILRLPLQLALIWWAYQFL